MDEKDRSEEAIKTYPKAIALDSFSFDTNYGLGESYCGIEEYEKAIRQFEKTQAIDSTKNGLADRIRKLKNHLQIQ